MKLASDMMFINYQENSKDINFPQGRGMVKWQPFATMPEQYENITRLMDGNIKVEKPLLSGEQMLNNEQTLKDSLCKNVRIRYWSNGFEAPLECKIESVVESSNLIIFSKNNQFIYKF